MAYAVFTTKYARNDIQDAINWENMRKPGLADYFLQDLENKISIISGNPLIYQIRYGKIRCTPTDIFQYLIHYTVDESRQQVNILRVLHTSRKPIW